MTTTTALILNSILAVGLLAALGYVMSGHRHAGSKAASEPTSLERERAERAAASGDFKRAA